MCVCYCCRCSFIYAQTTFQLLCITEKKGIKRTSFFFLAFCRARARFFLLLAEISSARLDRFEFRGSRFEFRDSSFGLGFYFKGFFLCAQRRPRATKIRSQLKLVLSRCLLGQAKRACAATQKKRESKRERASEKECQLVGWQSERERESETGLWESSKNFCYINDDFSSAELT